MPTMYEEWAVGELVKAGERRYYSPNETLYKCLQEHTTQEDWTPNATPALWVALDVSHAGTIDDPIPASAGMEYEYGKYYLDPADGKTYLCAREGAENGEKVTLQFLPHDLIGQYFKEV